MSAEKEKEPRVSVNVRLKPEDYDRIKRAADAVGMKPGTWMRMASLERAADSIH